MKRRALAAAAGTAVALAILAAGGLGHVDVLLLAVVGGITYFDLARRGLAEACEGTGDATDFWMSVAFASILVAAAWERRGTPPAALEDLRWLTASLGLATITLGFAVRQWAARTMGREFRVRLGTRPDHRLVEDGPFRWIRHPTYAGLLLVALGTAVALESMLALLAAVVVWLPTVILRMGREERLLSATFGADWEGYRRRTRRLVPGVY